MLRRRAREWLGAKLVQLGMRVIGIDEKKFSGRPTWGSYMRGDYEPPDEENDEDYEPDATSLPMQLNDTARSMVHEGMMATSPIKRSLPKEGPLPGSIDARMHAARERQQEALRPRRG